MTSSEQRRKEVLRHNQQYRDKALRTKINMLDAFSRLVVKWHRWRCRVAYGKMYMAQEAHNTGKWLRNKKLATHHLEKAKLVTKENADG
jgi:hypothetical protein